MAQLVGRVESESFSTELEDKGRSILSSFHLPPSNSRRSSSIGSMRDSDDEYELQWAAVERLPTIERMRFSLFEHKNGTGGGERKERQVVDVTKLGALERHLFVENLIRHIENDNLWLLKKQKERIDRVNVKQPTIEVRYKNLCVEAECEVVDGKPLPTLWNSAKSMLSGYAKVPGFKSQEATISIIKDVSGIIKPSRKVYKA